MRGQRHDRHADRLEGGHGLGGQVRVGPVDDRQVRDAGPGRGDHLGEIGAASHDGQGVGAGLDRLDDRRFPALIGQDHDSVDGAHEAPTGTAASWSVEVCEARRAGSD